MNRSRDSIASSDSQALTLLDVPDLVNLLADFCDDDSLSKLSRVIMEFNQNNRLIKMLER